MSIEIKPAIKLCNQFADVVDSEVYLDTTILNNVYEKPIDQLVCDFQRGSNHAVLNFKMCDSQTLCQIFFLIAKVSMVANYSITVCHTCPNCRSLGVNQSIKY